jgi:hypothetical protein
VKPKVE